MIDDDDDDCGAISGMNEWKENPKFSGKTCPSTALSREHEERRDFKRRSTGLRMSLNHFRALNNNTNNSIQFNSILYYLCAESTATRPITDTAQYKHT
jgi:hypothetical protein